MEEKLFWTLREFWISLYGHSVGINLQGLNTRVCDNVDKISRHIFDVMGVKEYLTEVKEEEIWRYGNTLWKRIKRLKCFKEKERDTLGPFGRKIGQRT